MNQKYISSTDRFINNWLHFTVAETVLGLVVVEIGVQRGKLHPLDTPAQVGHVGVTSFDLAVHEAHCDDGQGGGGATGRLLSSFLRQSPGG